MAEIVLIVDINPDGSVKMVQNHKVWEPGRHGMFVDDGRNSASKFRKMGGHIDIDSEPLNPFWKIRIKVDGNKFEVLEGHGYLKRGYRVVRDGYGWTIEQIQDG